MNGTVPEITKDFVKQYVNIHLVAPGDVEQRSTIVYPTLAAYLWEVRGDVVLREQAGLGAQGTDDL